MKSRIITFFFTIFSIISLTILIHFFNDYLEYEQESRIKDQMDLHLKELSDKLKDKKSILLTAAVLLSNDSDVKKCLSMNTRENCIGHLKDIQRTFNNLSFSKETKIHVHTKDLKSFFRLWELDKNKNNSLSSFRESLLMVKASKKELSGIEIGRSSMLLRGISPILNDGEYLGSIELISDFNSISKYYWTKGINFYVLMHQRYEDIVNKIDFKREDRLGKYIVVNEINSRLKSLEKINFQGTNYVRKGNFYILFTPIFDIVGREIGFYVLRINSEKIL